MLHPEVSAPLRRTQTLLGQHTDDGEACGVIGGDVGGFGICVGDESSGLAFSSGIHHPPLPGGLAAGDLLQGTGGQGGEDLLATRRPAHALTADGASGVSSTPTRGCDLICLISGSASSFHRLAEAITGLTGIPVRCSTVSAAP